MFNFRHWVYFYLVVVPRQIVNAVRELHSIFCRESKYAFLFGVVKRIER